MVGVCILVAYQAQHIQVTEKRVRTMSSKFLAMDGWLHRIGLRHPFRSATTSDSDDINLLCDPFAWISDLISSPDGHIIWGNPGEGKSAYRHILEQTLEAGLDSEKWLTLSLCRRELASLAESAAVAQRLDETWFAELLADTARSKLASEQKADESGPSLPNLHQKRTHGRGAPRKTTESVLDQLWCVLEYAGYTGCMVLVDEVDDVRGARGNPYVQRELVRPLFAEWFERPVCRWRAFLPQALRPYFTGEHAIGAKVQQWAIDWRPDHLQQMITDRMLYYSEQKYETIGDLCDEELGVAVDADLIALSQGNPRAAITLASMLFREHCQRSPIPRVIERESWRKVCDEWERHNSLTFGDRTQLGREEPADVQEYVAAPPPAQAAAPVPAELCFDATGAIWAGTKEITRKLNKRRYTILKLLYDNQGKVVTKDELINVGWLIPENEDASGVSDDMLRQQINHIRDILSREIEYIESVSGRGYRLSVTGIGTRKSKPAAPQS